MAPTPQLRRTSVPAAVALGFALLSAGAAAGAGAEPEAEQLAGAGDGTCTSLPAQDQEVEIPSLALMQLKQRLSSNSNSILKESATSLLAFGAATEQRTLADRIVQPTKEDGKGEGKEEAKQEGKGEGKGKEEEAKAAADGKGKDEAKPKSEDGASEEKAEVKTEVLQDNSTENASNSSNATNVSNVTEATMCATRKDARARAFFATTSPEGTPCVFGVEGDVRDEGLHCIYDDGMYGSNGWCYTAKDRTSWGSCNEHCPLYGSAATLGRKIQSVAKVIKEVATLVNGSAPPDGEAAGLLGKKSQHNGKKVNSKKEAARKGKGKKEESKRADKGKGKTNAASKMKMQAKAKKS